MIPGRFAAARLVIAAVIGVTPLVAQTPKPFPSPSPPATPQTPTTPPRPAPGGAAAAAAPTEAMLGAPIFQGAQFITSYDAGRGQRFYLFGAAAPFLEVVTFYRTSLKQRGELLFETPPTHQFETGRFRDETMAFPPSVTIKDYTFGGSAGYPNPAPGGKPQRFATIIQFVPPPPGTPPGQ
jgi:hypothetical protein